MIDFCDLVLFPFNVSKIVFKLTKNANDLQNENNYCLFGYGYKELLIIPKPYDCYILYQNVYVVLKHLNENVAIIHTCIHQHLK